MMTPWANVVVDWDVTMDILQGTAKKLEGEYKANLFLLLSV
jgi:hypothetical protein